MDITHKKAHLFDAEADVYVSPVYKKETKKTEEGRISGEYGKKTISAVDYKGRTRKVYFLGLGERPKLTAEKIRQAAGQVVKDMKSLNIESFASEIWGEDTADKKAQIEGFMLADYDFTPYKSEKQPHLPRKATVVSDDAGMNKVIEEAAKEAKAVFAARNLMNTPSNDMTPAVLAGAAKKLAKASKKIKVKVIDKEQIKKLGMGAFYGVAKGSDEPAKLILIEFSNGRKGEKPLAFVGKGITFDSGGISIKSSDRMENMKFDMSGAAVVLSLISAAAELGIRENIVGVIPATENLPSGHAYKPGDILKSMSGKTIEVISTDAEGRLILSDAITFAVNKYKPRVLVDIATLTGACVVALGNKASGLMGNNSKVTELMKESGEATGERVWELPMWEEYREQIKGKYADIKNTGGGGAGTITAGMFLKEFVKETPWAHLDIAGVAYGIKHKNYIPETGSGFGVRLLIEFIRRAKDKKF